MKELPTFTISGDKGSADSVTICETDSQIHVLLHTEDEILDLNTFEKSNGLPINLDVLNGFLEGKERINFVTDDERSVLVPHEVESDSAKQSIHLWVNGGRRNVGVQTDDVPAHDATQYFGANENWINWLESSGKQFSISHANSGFVQQPSPVANCVYCLLQQRKFKLIVFRNHALQLLQDYSFQTPADAAYHLLNAIQLNDLGDDATVYVAGMFELDSPVYNEMKKYVQEVELLPAAPGKKFHAAFEEYPSHYYNYLSYWI